MQLTQKRTPVSIAMELTPFDLSFEQTEPIASLQLHRLDVRLEVCGSPLPSVSGEPTTKLGMSADWLTPYHPAV
jgi:hypothetical protein